MAGAERLVSEGPSDTERIAAELASSLRAGEIVLVSGELGAGKTTFVRGACRGLGVSDRVASPTFTIARRYESGRVPVSHLDLFRLSGEGGGDPGLLEDELAADRVAFVEWPGADESLLRALPVAARVRIEHAGGDRRTLVIEREVAA